MIKLRNKLYSRRYHACQKGVISLAETMIVLGIGVTILAIWTQNRLSQMELDNARHAGRAIATYARAASNWLAESPPGASGTYNLSALQDCTDPNGLRFLSCSFGAETTIPYLTATAGDPVTFGQLEIEVTLNPTGTLGVIDFGVFRSGNDADGDGLPDARPDLAAAAFQTATEQTGAGVMNFFELTFAESDPSSVIFDQSDPNYDPAKVEDFSRLQARVGALASGDAPFLRLDGGNEMTAGVNFENGMQVNMSEDGLIVEGLGDVEVSTTTGDLVVTGNIEANRLQASSAELDQLQIEPHDGVTGAGFNRFNQAPDVLRIDSEINRLSSRVTTNELNIQTNTRAISTNRQEIAKNAADIDTLGDQVAVNTEAIERNRQRIAQNSQNILNLSNNSNPACTPSRASVLRDNPGQLTCGGECHYCGSYRSTSVTRTYRTRNQETLGCNTHSVRIYTSCCFIASGNCDGGICGVSRC